MWSTRGTWSGPIAAEFSLDDDGGLHVEDVVAEHYGDGDWFRESWWAHEDRIREASEGRRVFILGLRFVGTRLESIDYGTDYDEDISIEVVL